MSEKRRNLAFWGVTVLFAACAVAESSNGPAFGQWSFIGKDNKGVAWTGTLTIERTGGGEGALQAMCSLEVQSNHMGRGVSAACKYDAATRILSFGNKGPSNAFSYRAVLSPDGRSLTEGRWSETVRSETTTGEWSATFKSE